MSQFSSCLGTPGAGDGRIDDCIASSHVGAGVVLVSWTQCVQGAFSLRPRETSRIAEAAFSNSCFSFGSFCLRPTPPVRDKMFPNKHWTASSRNAFAVIYIEYARTVTVMSRTPRPSKSNVAQRPRKMLELPVPPTHRREPALLLISFILVLIGGV